MFHFLFVSWEKFKNNGAEILAGDNYVLIALAVVMFVFIHWRGLFLLISAVVNFYQLETAAKKYDSNMGVIFAKQIITGIVLIIIGKIWAFAFPYWGFIELWSRDPSSTFWGGTITLAFYLKDHWAFVFIIEAIDSIGLMMIITSFFFVLFHYFRGKYAWLVKVVFLNVIGYTIIFVSPLIIQWASNIHYGDSLIDTFRHINGVRIEGGGFGFWELLRHTVIIWIGGREAPLFPMLGSYFVGASFGYIITQENPKRTQLRWMLIPSAIAVIVGVVDLFFFYEYAGLTGIDAMFANIGFHVHPRWFAMISIGLQAPIILASLAIIEFNPKLNQERWLKYTRWIRRFGVFTLTLYFLGVFDFLVRWVIRKIVHAINPSSTVDFITRYGLADGWTFAILGILMGLWAIGIFVWDKVGKGYLSVDFFVNLLRIPKKGRKRDWKDPMNLQGILYDVQMVTFWKKP